MCSHHDPNSPDIYGRYKLVHIMTKGVPKGALRFNVHERNAWKTTLKKLQHHNLYL